MKKFILSAIAAIGMFIATATPAYACVGNACPTTTTPTVSSPAPSSSSIWGSVRTSGTGQGYSSAWNNNDGGDIIASGVGREGLGEVVGEGEIVANSCGLCDTNSVTGRVTGRVAERAFSFQETTGRFAEGGSSVQANFEGSFDGHVGRTLTYDDSGE